MCSSRGSLLGPGLLLHVHAGQFLAEHAEAFCTPQTLLSPSSGPFSARGAPPRTMTWGLSRLQASEVAGLTASGIYCPVLPDVRLLQTMLAYILCRLCPKEKVAYMFLGMVLWYE